MPTRHVVVDGSNIATEGRSLPSLAQLDTAVQEFLRDFPDSQVTVVVDATFGHRIDESERAMLEEAEAHGEVVSPPAGAIGRGDAFLLLIAERTGATVFSNDSFQEFHGEHEWLFEKGRLIGGKPVPGVGWIFTPRTPVRGPKSREAIKDAKRNQVRIGSPEASRPMPVPKTPPPGWAPGEPAMPAAGLAVGGPAPAAVGGQAPQGGPPPRAVASGLAKTRVDPKVRKAIEAATKEVESPDSTAARRRRRRRGAGPPPQAVNDPLAFITFIAEHALGSEVEGEVEGFTSHGAFVGVDGAIGYVPLTGLGDPAPTKARSVLSKGERRTFVLQALDAQRRGLELALPAFAHLSGSPSEETVEAEITEAAATVTPKKPRSKRASASAPSVPTPEVPAPATDGAPSDSVTPAKRTRRRAPKPDPAVASSGPVEAGPSFAEPSGSEPSGADTPAVPDKPSAKPAKPAARRTRRPADGAKVDPPEPLVAANAEPTGGQVDGAEPPAVPEEPAAAAATPAKPAARRTRRPAANAEPTGGQIGGAEPAEPAKPARRTRRPATEAEPPAVPEEPAAAATPAKPAARRTRRPAAKAEPTEGQVDGTAPPTAPEEPAAEAATPPKPARRTRRPAAKAEPTGGQVDVAEPPAVPEEPAATATPAKPAARRTRRVTTPKAEQIGLFEPPS